MFFRRIWERLHPEDDGDGEPAPTKNDETANKEDDKSNDDQAMKSVEEEKKENEEEPPWERIIGDCPVVKLEDRGLVADSQLSAIAQMKLTELTEADQIGWFKHRKVRNQQRCACAGDAGCVLKS